MSDGFALVLQGGGIRGAYTAGVLDVLMEHNFWADYVLGVSAGAMNGMNYVSKQIGRSKSIFIELSSNKKIYSLKNILKCGSIYNFDYLFSGIKEVIVPFDYERFYENKMRYIACATNLETGRPIYFEKGCAEYDIDLAIKASASLPLVSKPVFVGDTPCLDGGVSATIPLKKAMEDGNKKIVVIMTRDASFQKDENKKNHLSIAKRRYRDYPHFLEAYRNQNSLYNNCLKYVGECEQKGMVFVIRPKSPIAIDDVRDKEKIISLYEKGRNDCHNLLTKLEVYLHE
ncbi:MAG: patatin family protein [Bacilli bacterium]|jgi:predicted patatin/cPLA2 family phospholipase